MNKINSIEDKYANFQFILYEIVHAFATNKGIIEEFNE